MAAVRRPATVPDDVATHAIDQLLEQAAGNDIVFSAGLTGQNPLFVAAKGRTTVEDMRELLRIPGVRARLDERDEQSGFTALHAACAGGRADIARELAAAGADVDCRTTGDRSTPLHLVCRFLHNYYRVEGREETVAALIGEGADLSSADRDGKTALHYASMHYEGITRSLLHAGASPISRTRRGDTPLHLSIRVGSTRGALESIRALLAAGAPLLVEDSQGRCPIDLARAERPMAQRHGHLMRWNMRISDLVTEEMERRRRAWRREKLQRRCWMVAVKEELDVEDFLPPIVISLNRRWAAAHPWVFLEPDLNAL